MTACSQWIEKLEHPHPPSTREERLKRAREKLSKSAEELQLMLDAFHEVGGLDPLVHRAKSLMREHDKFYESLSNLLEVANPVVEGHRLFEEDTILDRVKAIESLSSRLGFAATLMGPIIRHREP